MKSLVSSLATIIVSVSAQAEIVYKKNYDAKVRFLPASVQMTCIKELRPKDVTVPVDVVEIPETGFSDGALHFITPKMIEVGERIAGTWAQPELFEEISEATPDIIHSLRRLFGGNMEVNYRYEKDPNKAEQLAKKGYKKMVASRRVPPDAPKEEQLVINLWVRNRSDQIQSYGTVTAMLTLTSAKQEVNKKIYKYRANFELDGDVAIHTSGEPSDPKARQRSQTMADSFRRTVMRNVENFKKWLNRPRTLLNVQQIKELALTGEGVQRSYPTEINARWCGERVGVRGVVEITARDVTVLVNTPLGLEEGDPEQKPR